jgi:hypothetical protein
MDCKTNDGNRQDRSRFRGLNLAALGPALVVIVYGFGHPPDALLASDPMDAGSAPFEVTGAAPAGTRIVLAKVDTAALTDAQRMDASRECAPAEGIADACVYE